MLGPPVIEELARTAVYRAGEDATGSAEAGGARENSKEGGWGVMGGGMGDTLYWIWSEFTLCSLNFGREGAEMVNEHDGN